MGIPFLWYLFSVGIETRPWFDHLVNPWFVNVKIITGMYVYLLHKNEI